MFNCAAAGHNYIGTEHILLGLLREGEGVAARVLETLGATNDKIKTQVHTCASLGPAPYFAARLTAILRPSRGDSSLADRAPTSGDELLVVPE